MRGVRVVALVLFLPAGAWAQDSGTQVAEAAPTGAAAAAPAAADEGRKDYAQISIEELLDKDISVAATKTRVDVAKAPVSVTVLTPDDIRRSGTTSLGELLRTVPGLDVFESFPGHVSVSARGTSEVFVNNMLVLVDGRRLEFQVAGVPFFENAPVRLEDVKRIEVVKGPVGALYGTNALAGIISITTYSPDEVAGTLVSLTGGERDTFGATLRQAGSLGGGWSYKLVGGYSYTSTWASLEGSAAPPVALRKGDLVGLLERPFEGDARLQLEAGYTKGDLASLSIVTNQTRYFSWPHFRAAYSRPDFHVQLTASPQSSELRERTGPVQPLTDDARAVNLALDRTLAPFSRTKLTVGGNLRYQRSTFTSIAVPHDQVLWGVFLQDQQELVSERVSFIGAVGLSGHPEIPVQVDGNVALVLSPVRDHSFRLSAGRGHRAPSFNENFFDFQRRIGTRDGYQSSNTDLDPERLRALEAGYHGRLRMGSSTLRLFAEGFVERIDDLIGTVTTIVAPGTVPRYPAVTVVQQFRNLEDRDGRGFEVGADWSVGSVGLLGQYAFQTFENAATGARIEKDVPRHKVSGALRVSWKKLELDVWGHSVSRSVEDEGYFLLNPRLGLRFRDWDLSVAAFNALDDRHVESANERGVKGEMLRRAVSVSLSRRFGSRR